MEAPEVRYARTRDDVWIAYHVVGDRGPPLLVIPGWQSNLEVMWELPQVQAFYTQLSRHARVIHHDQRGTGLSDRVADLPDLETQVDDMCAVLDEIGVRRCIAVGLGSSVTRATVLAALRPERTLGVVLYGSGWALRHLHPTWDPAADDAQREELRLALGGWGTERYAAWFVAADDPSMQDDRAFIRWAAKVQRHWIPPGAAADMIREDHETDVTGQLRTVQVPILFLTREGWEEEQRVRLFTSTMPNATLEVLPPGDAMPWLGETGPFLDAIDRFVRGHRASRPDRTLTTVLFTDVVQSTVRMSEIGDEAWAEVIERHHAIVRRALVDSGGSEIDTAGDGFFATFTAPAAAARCALDIAAHVKELGIEIRAGIHTGEVETVDDKVAGIAVTIGARIGAAAAPSEVLVSSTVKDLVAGSGLRFEDAGEHELKGVPDRWHLYRVVG
jgi:class 3 adenylate cyclase/pimeloyl-ACP methyl ester carboxylesterase